MLILNKDKFLTLVFSDLVVRAGLPDAELELQLYHLVKTHMIHVKCGPRAPFFRDGACRYHFPKSFRDCTLLHYHGFVQYRRTDDGCTCTIKRKVYDNRHVVPYSPYLLLKY
ncbi:hypothetical protein PR048_030251 [Dryococelus australis]|uniref:Uncharacterized protein n=1 Tax=Dryococelus australis TaxID=614101 RepID=A0ABQ9G990_9NEOP|nr:hypothetical protein PR048_030251 [Dryococelus australis]